MQPASVQTSSGKKPFGPAVVVTAVLGNAAVSGLLITFPHFDRLVLWIIFTALVVISGTVALAKKSQPQKAVWWTLAAVCLYGSLVTFIRMDLRLGLLIVGVLCALVGGIRRLLRKSVAQE